MPTGRKTSTQTQTGVYRFSVVRILVSVGDTCPYVHVACMEHLEGCVEYNVLGVMTRHDVSWRRLWLWQSDQIVVTLHCQGCSLITFMFSSHIPSWGVGGRSWSQWRSEGPQRPGANACIGAPGEKIDKQKNK